MLQEKGRRIVTLDPNIRPSLVRAEESTYRARLTTMLATADLIKISIADLGWLAPGRECVAIANEWLAQGAALVVVTAGGDGSTAYVRGGRVIHRAARRITLVDTVGAGDSFMGALLVGLDACGVTSPTALAAVDDATVDAVLAFAAEVSAITCSRAGADPPRRAEVTLPARTSGTEGTRR
jgi:fructokinase